MVLLAGVAGCVHPMVLTDEKIYGDLAARYAEYHHAAGDPDPARDADLVRPRLGLPVLARATDGFPVEWLERGGPMAARALLVRHELTAVAAARCLERALVEKKPAPAQLPAELPAQLPAELPAQLPDGCVELSLDGLWRDPIAGSDVSRVHAAAHPIGSAPAGSYDLLFASDHDATFRASRAVWIQLRDPVAPRPLRIALLSDPHIGKRVAHLEENFATVIAEINRIAPDLVLISGDITNLGQDASLGPRAAAFVERFEVPVLVVIGNHDHGFGTRAIFTQEHGTGYFHFARAFHPLLFYRATIGGWDFVGFDSGPSQASPTVNNRGLAPETLARVAEALAAARDNMRRGVVLLSHCTSRASLSGRGSPSYAGAFGRMADGGEELERLELAGADAGLRVLHLGGHTHWSDLFEAHRTAGKWEYRLIPRAPLDGPRRLDTPAAIVTVQSATHAGLFVKESARGFGYALLDLEADKMELQYVRHLDGPPEPAPGDPFVTGSDR